MGESRKVQGGSLKEAAELLPMLNCCTFAYLVMIDARNLIQRNLIEGLPINSELSLELYNKSRERFNKIENSGDYYLPGKISYCYPPKIEGGDRYNLDLKTIKDRKKFRFDTFKYSISLKFRGYSCYFARTIALHHTHEYRKNFEFMTSVYENVLNNLKDGIELRKVYQTVQSLAEKENKDLAMHLEKEFGFELGPNFRKESVTISVDSTVVVQKGMFFAVNINLIGLKDRELEYSIHYSNTVVVKKDQPPDVLTCYTAARVVIEPSNR